MDNISAQLQTLNERGWSDAAVAQGVQAFLTRAIANELGMTRQQYEQMFGFSAQPSGQSIYRWRTSKSSPTSLAIVAIIHHLYENVQQPQ